MPTVYLAGPINDCTDAEAMDWRTEATASLAGEYRVLDPMRRDYRGREAEHVTELVEGDKADIRASDVVLVNADRPTWGTAMEVQYAHDQGKRVVAFCAGSVSPWLRYHAEVYPSYTVALAAVEVPHV